ncbi:NADH dehydrogenase subunit A [Geoglobus ahangari]|uniref:NADH dehydrogenase subunit A n=1 Tax=Geoglobus ahangari TaxID=113653 RepID=A0A0F7IHT0_9EURY|nr:NADH-quinone oxidoreductase subunit A [Geoglobus ahangari]AKG92305.1 NADH dehydrogenase subunit A [Geoglobus ahangari]NOY11125.1 NAD(P)H-quinone oxidoreductase subunit 3 [Archaeoglobi archaeon]
MDEVIVVGFVIILSVVVDVVIYGLSRILPKRNPTELKYLRWESGNISVGLPKYTLPMQYYGFVVLFMAFEPIVVLLLLFAAFPGLDYLKFLAISMIALLPGFYFAYRIAYDAANRRDVYG